MFNHPFLFNVAEYEDGRGWIYVFMYPQVYDAEPECAGLVKIGWSLHPAWRHDGPFGYEDTVVLVVLPGTEREEKTIHRLLKPYRATKQLPKSKNARTEHYYPCNPVLDKVAELIQRMRDWWHEEMAWQHETKWSDPSVEDAEAGEG